MKTLIDYFLENERAKASTVFLRQPIGKKWKTYTWQYVGDCARRVAAFLENQDLPKKSHIGIISKNCAEWIIVDLAITFAGHVSVPLFHNIGKNELEFIVQKADLKMLFVGKLDKWKARKEILPETLETIRLPHYDDNEFIRAKHNYEKIIERYEPIKEINKPDLNDLFSIVYTSGTTGNPKGVMLNWQAISNLMEQQLIYDDLKLREGEIRLFSYLPLNHIAERVFIESLAIFKGASISFVENTNTFQQNMVDTEPTHFISVPRLWERFRAATLNKIGEKQFERRMKLPVASALLKRSVIKSLGLGKAKLLLTGATPMANSTIKWFKQLGLNIQEVYGMTENCGVCCLMPKENIVAGTVGKPLNGVDLKIDELTGEVLMKSDWLMIGYFDETRETEAVFDGEYLKTGDCGEILPNGFLKLSGRINDPFVTLKGKTIDPIPLENKFKANIYVEQVCVTGNNLEQPIALIELSKKAKKEKNDVVSKSLLKILEEANIGLPKYQKLDKVILVHDKWNTENGFLTPTLKLKRNFLFDNYESKLLKWAAFENKVVWE